MGFFDIFKKPLPKKLQASVTLYLDRILIETIDQVKEGFGISSTKIAILSVNCNNETLGLKVREHLELTEHNLPIPKDFKKHYADYLNVAGFKTIKHVYQDALYIYVYQKNDIITICPSKNGGTKGKDRGFTVIIDEDIIIPCTATNIEIGESIKIGWTRCK